MKNKINSKGEHMEVIKYFKDVFGKLANGDYDLIYERGNQITIYHYHYEIFYEFSIDMLKVLIDTYLQAEDNYRRVSHFKWILENNAFIKGLNRKLNLNQNSYEDAKQFAELIESHEEFKKFLLENKYIAKYTLNKFKKTRKIDSKVELKKFIENNFTYYHIKVVNIFNMRLAIKRLKTMVEKSNISLSELTQNEVWVLNTYSAFFTHEMRQKIFVEGFERIFNKSKHGPITRAKSLISGKMFYNTTNLIIASSIANTYDFEFDEEFIDFTINQIEKNSNMVFMLVPYKIVAASKDIKIELPSKLNLENNLANNIIINMVTKKFNNHNSKLIGVEDINKIYKIAEKLENASEDKLLYKILKNI